MTFSFFSTFRGVALVIISIFGLPEHQEIVIET